MRTRHRLRNKPMNLPKAEIDRDTAMRLWQSEHSEYAKEQLVLANIGMVGIILKSLNLSTQDEDLYSVGIVGLVKAVNSFDAEKGFKFSTYATRVIRNEILMTLRKKRVDVAFSLDDTANLENGEEVPYADLVSSGERFENEVIAKVQYEEMLCKLSDRKRNIMILFFVHNKTQREISSIMGLSQSYISRIIKGVQRKYGS